MTSTTRLLVVLMLAAGLTSPAVAVTTGWEALWWNADQRAARLMQRDKHAEAARTFDDRRWRAAALYRAGEYSAAAEAWSALDEIQAHYNRGNALARAGDLPAAAEAYETVLENDPDHADARYNLELIRELMQENENDQDGDPGEDDSRQQEQSDSESQESSDNDSGQQKDRRSSSRQERDGQDEGSPEDGDTGDSPRDSQAGDDGSGEQSREQQSGEPEQSPAEPPEQGDAAQDGTEARSSRDDAGDPSEQAAMEQWLRRIPDDPGGLLRRKFRYQYQRRERGEDEVREPW